MNAERSSGTGTWVGLAAFVCGTLVISSSLVADANPSSALVKERLAASALSLPQSLAAEPTRVTSDRVDDHESVIHNFRGDWFRARVRYEVYDEGATARDAYHGHREGDRSAAMSSRDRVNRGSIPPRHRARFFAPAPGVTASFCRTTGDWYAECVADRWRTNVIAEVWVNPRGGTFAWPSDLIGDALSRAQALLREGVEHLETI